MNEKQKNSVDPRAVRAESLRNLDIALFLRNLEESGETAESAERMYSSFERIFKTLSEELGAEVGFKDSKILEIGSSKSLFLDYLKEQGVDAVGVDAQPHGETEGLRVVAARIEQLPFPDDVFDIVVSGEVFDKAIYNQDHRLMLEEVRRVLKPGGIWAGSGESIKASVEGLTLISDPKDFVSIYRKA